MAEEWAGRVGKIVGSLMGLTDKNREVMLSPQRRMMTRYFSEESRKMGE